MNQMKESFETNLASSQKEEAENVKAYEDLKAAKEEEIAAGQSQDEAKTQELATTDENLAQARQDLKDTKKSLAADTEFLATLKEKCEMADHEYGERVKTRTEEIAATSKALEILNSDEAQQMFSKTFSFLQESSQMNAKMMATRRLSVSKMLSRVGLQFSNPGLSALAVRVRLDSFTRVKKAVDDMIQQLLAEKADEIKHRDFCIEEFNTNAQQTQTKEGEKKDLTAKINDLNKKIEELTATIDTLKAEVAEMQLQMKHGGEDREFANLEFQKAIAEQRASQQILTKALDVLKGFYKAAMLQQQADQPAQAEYAKNNKSGGVMGMIQSIIDDAAKMEAEAIRAEEDAQKAYEDFTKETNASIEAKNKDIANKSEVRAQAEADLSEAKETMENTELELTQLANMNAELHKSCDFVMANFDARQTARDAEVEALRQAKAILSGAK
jgi:chromosome segregation ATPase